MAHYTILMIGTTDNLCRIYADCQDSSSETTAEMTFGYDSCIPIDIISGKIYFYLDEEDACMFKKDSEVFNKYVCNGIFNDVWDIRNNDCDNLIYNCDNPDPKRPKEVIIDYLRNLPDDTTFFYCDAHL